MKKVIWILGTMTTIVAFGALWIILSDFMEVTEGKNEEIKEKSPETEELSEEPAEEVEAEEQESQEVQNVDLNPFGQALELSDISDVIYQDYLHKMSHQKVQAQAKWGFYEITDERINWLLEVLPKVALEHADVYKDILTRWVEGDFSIVDKDHNNIWKLQGGTVGEATGILDPDTERRLIEYQREQKE